MARSAAAMPSLESATERPPRLGDALLVPPVEGPLLDAPGPDQPESGEDLEMLVRARLAHPQLVGDEEAADAVLDQIAVDLRGEVGPRPLEPVEDGQAAP